MQRSNSKSAARDPSVFWFLPTNRDSRSLSVDVSGREPDISYLKQVALAADALGYHGVLVPTGASCEDPWIVSAFAASVTERLKFLVAVRPGTVSPTVAARMAATLDSATRGRVLINVVTGADPVENAGEGLFLDHAERYRQLDEWVSVFKGLLGGKRVSHAGEFVRVEKAQLSFPPRARLQTYFGGSSQTSFEIGARLFDTFLTWGEPPDQVALKIQAVRAVAAAAGQQISFGLRIHIVVRRTAQEAWAAAERLIEDLSDEELAAAQQTIARSQSIGQRYMSSLHGGRRDNLEISPNLWAGVGLARGGNGTALVGDPQTVAARLREYQSLGISTFILSGYPHLEEAHRVAELLFPELGIDGRQPAAAMGSRKYGEAIVD